MSYTPSEAAPFPLALQNNTRRGTSIWPYLGKQSGALIKNQLFSSEAQNNYIFFLKRWTPQTTDKELHI